MNETRSHGPLLETIMAALKAADVLKPDKPDYPTHYNRAWSAVNTAIVRHIDRELAALNKKS